MFRLFEALAEVVPASQIGPWLDTPNPAFEGSTSLQVIERGESDRLWRSCGHKWLACLTPFFKESERKSCGSQHRLFFSQVEYCDNLILYRRAALDQLDQRLLDANRTIGQPSKIPTS